MSIVCPVHNQEDMVQSVPALVAGGTSSGTFSGPSGGVTYIDGKQGYTAGSTTLRGTFTTDIANQLAAPLPPNDVSFIGVVGWSFLFLFSISLVVGPFWVWKSFKNNVVRNPEIQEKVFGHGGNGLSFFMLFWGWQPLVWPFIPSFQKKLKKDSEYDRRYNLWVDAYRKWEKLYYCHRCGVVINPENKHYCKPHELNDFLETNRYL